VEVVQLSNTSRRSRHFYNIPMKPRGAPFLRCNQRFHIDTRNFTCLSIEFQTRSRIELRPYARPRSFISLTHLFIACDRSAVSLSFSIYLHLYQRKWKIIFNRYSRDEHVDCLNRAIDVAEIAEARWYFLCHLPCAIFLENISRVTGKTFHPVFAEKFWHCTK